MVKKRTSQSRSMPVSITIGTVTQIILCVVLSAILAALIGGGKLREEGMGLGALAVLFVSSCCGCILSVKLAKEQVAVICGLTAAAYTAVLVVVNILFFDGVFANWGSKLLAVLLGAVVSCILCAGKGRKKRTR